VKIRKYVFAFSCIIASNLLSADDGILGDWAGVKSTLEENGVTAESVIAIDSFSNASGGIEEGSANFGNFDLIFNIDTEKAGLWKNGTFFFYGLGNFGDSLSEL
jgi:porin